MELFYSGRKYCASIAVIFKFIRRPDSGGRRIKTGFSRAFWLCGFLSYADQRWHAQAGSFGAGDCLRSRDYFFDEPSAGLDPISSRMLDDLILQLRDTLKATIVVVSHELASIFAVGDKAAFLDAETKSMTAIGSPKELLANSKDSRVIQFLTRGGK